MKKCLLLSRVSTGQQELESQTNDLINEARRLGYSDSQQIIVENVESAIKLSENERLGIQRMKYEIEHDNSIDLVICWEPSRISRRQAMLYSVRDYLLEHKIQLIILKPAYIKLLNDDRTDFDTTASIVFSLFSTISESEMKLKMQRQLRAKALLKSQGKKATGMMVFGYKKNKDKTVSPHPEESKVIIELINKYVNENTSTRDLFRWASKTYPQYFPLINIKKGSRRIQTIFAQKIYWEGNEVYPPLISSEMGMKLREKLKNSRIIPRFTENQYMCRGLLFSKFEGKDYMYTPSRKYNCFTCTYGGTGLHKTTSISMTVIDKIVWEEETVPVANMNAGLYHNENISTIISKKDKLQEAMSVLEGHKQEYEKKQEKLLTVWLDGSISEKIYKSQNESIKQQINDIDKKIDDVLVEINNIEMILRTTQESLLKVRNINYDSIDSLEMKRELIDKYINKVYINEIKPFELLIEFEYKNCLVPQRGRYRYVSRGGYQKCWRLNEDETEDRII